MSQLSRHLPKRLMYLENKDGEIDGYSARIGWVRFSRTARTIYYRDRVLKRIKRGGVSGNFYCEETGDEFWVSGVKHRGSNTHWAEPVEVFIDPDAREAYQRHRTKTLRAGQG